MKRNVLSILDKMRRFIAIQDAPYAGQNFFNIFFITIKTFLTKDYLVTSQNLKA